MALLALAQPPIYRTRPTSHPDRELAERFDRHFLMLRADTPELRREVFRIRHEVYCRELGYEDPNAFPDGLESDEFDHHALHALLMHRETATYAGCVRFVYNQPDCSGHRLPFEAHSAEGAQAVQRLALPRAHFGEASRLAITAHFRRRASENAATAASAPMHVIHDRRELPHVAVGLYLAAIAFQAELGVEYMFALMEPCLVRLMHRVGIKFSAHSTPFDYRGTRAVYAATLEQFEAGFKPEIWPLYQHIQQVLCRRTV